jgi:O-antigen/teichoic acid export membrane protein
MDEPSLAEDTALRAGEIQRRAISGALWTSAHTIVTVPLAFLANALVARSLGVDTYGRLAFLTATIGLAIVVADFGVSAATIQNGSGAEAAGRRTDVDGLLHRSQGFRALVELPLLLAVAASLTRNDPPWVVACVAVSVVLTCLLGGASLAITIENRTALGAKISFVLTLVILAASVVIAATTKSAAAVWAVRLVIPAAALLVNVCVLDRRRRRAVIRPWWPFSLGRRFWRFSLLSWASGVVLLLAFSRSEIFIMQWFHQQRALGLFALAFGLAGVLTAPADAMLHALLPAVAGVLTAHPERAEETFDRGSRFSTLICGALIAAVVPALAFAVPVIYGSAFEEAAWLFVPLAVASVLQSASNPSYAFANGRQRGGVLLTAGCVALAVDIALALALIPPFHAWGAVVANASAYVVGVGWIVASEPFAGGRGLRACMNLYRPFLAGVAPCAVALLAGAALQSTSAVAAACVAGAAGAAGYVLIVQLTRSGLTIQDRNAVLAVLAVRLRGHVAQLLRPITTPQAL